MNAIEYDVNKAIDIATDCELSTYHGFRKYDRIYASSNEYLDDIFNHIKLVNKDVLAFASSGDQAFNFFDRRVKI